MSILEAIMLICFGAAWPFSIYKSITSRTTHGKSLTFLIILLFGYMFGILHKFVHNLDWVVILYMINFIMVAIDSLLFFRNKKIEEV
jgi:hypothetical protein